MKKRLKAKRAAATKSATKKKAIKKSGAGKSASNGSGRAERATYTPGPIPGTGWPPFRYPLQ